MSRNLRRAFAVTVSMVVLVLTPAVTSAGGGGTFAKNTTTVSIGSARLAPGGAIVNLTYSCFPGGYGPYSTFGDVRMADVHGGQGFNTFQPICNDRKQTAGVFVPGNFSPGDAAVSAFVCGFDCNGATKEVKLR
jgi:hypothetical protein